VVELGHETPLRLPLVAAASDDQVLAPSFVVKIVPWNPTAKQRVRLGQDSPASVLPWGSGFCQPQVLVPVVARLG
jgi:hypothetical protein